MTSDQQVFNSKVVRLVEAVDFHITIILIRVRMQKLQAKLCAAAVFGRIIRAGVRIIRVIEALRFQKVGAEAG